MEKHGIVDSIIVGSNNSDPVRLIRDSINVLIFSSNNVLNESVSGVIVFNFAM